MIQRWFPWAVLAAASLAGGLRAQGLGVLGMGDGPSMSAPMTLPEVPEIRFTYAAAGETRLHADTWFDPGEDTPVFENQSYLVQGRSRSDVSGGTCFGITLLVADWYREIVYPIRSQWFPRVWNQGNRVELTDVLRRIPGPIHRDNLDAEYRMRPYTRKDAGRKLAAQIAIQRQELQSNFKPKIRTAESGNNHVFLKQRFLEDLAAEDRRLSGFSVSLGDEGWTSDSGEDFETGRHALLVYAAYEGVMRSARGTEEPVTRFVFFDPNHVMLPGQQEAYEAKHSLYFFERTQRFSFSGEYIDGWAGAGGLAQRAATIGDRDVRYLTYFDSSARSQADYMMRLLPRGFEVSDQTLETYRNEETAGGE